MTIAPPPMPPRNLRTTEAARLLGLSASTLEKHRMLGTGPAFQKLGGRVVYTVEALKLWEAQGTRISTSDQGKGRIIPLPCRHRAPPRGSLA